MNVYLYQNNTEKILKNAYIGEVWTPGSNTLLYMPLNGDAKDEASGNYGTWSGTEQYQTLSSGLKVANCNNSSYILTPSFAMNTALTLSGWLYRSSGYVLIRCDGRSGTRNFYQIVSTETQAGGAWYYNGTGYGGEFGNSTGWKHCVLTCGSNGIDVYINGSNVYNNSSVTSFVWKTQQWGINIDQYSTSEPIHGAGYYSDIIIENKARTAEEISHYYNLTKSNYGL